MRAGDIMTEVAICVDQGASIFEAAELMLSAGVSALPVVDSQSRIVGIISEADLMRRGEIGTTARESWLSRLVADK
ncbi:MAG: CBS domain-containing protein, partial [Reyranella sp.]